MDSDLQPIMASPSDNGTAFPGYHPQPRSRAVAQAHKSSTASRGSVVPVPSAPRGWEDAHGSNGGREYGFSFPLSVPSDTRPRGRDVQPAQEKRKRSESHAGNSGANYIVHEKDRPMKRPQRPEKPRMSISNPGRANDVIVLDDEDKEARGEHSTEDIGYSGDGSLDNAYWGQFMQGGEDLQPMDANPPPRRRQGTSDNRTALCVSQVGSPRFGGGVRMGARTGSHGGLKRRPESERVPQNPQGPHEISNPPASLSLGPLDTPNQGTSGHSLLSALSSLTTEKVLIEQKLSETTLELKAKCFLVEATGAKISELEDQNKQYKEVTSGLKSRFKGFQKFVDGLGKDYDTLREKNTQLSRKLDEIAIERGSLLSSVSDARTMTENFEERLQVLSASRREFREETKVVIEKLTESNEYLLKQLSENAGLLASERDRTQSLECQTQNDKKFYQEQLLQSASTLAVERDRMKVLEKQIQEADLKEVNIIKAIEDIKVELAGKVILGLTAKFEEIQDAIAAGMQNMKLALETSGDRNEDLIRRLALEVGRVDVPSLLEQMERTVKSASDDILGLLHSTQQPPDTTAFGREFIAHLTSQIQGFEKNLEEMHRRRECDLVERVQMEEQVTALTEELSELQNEVLRRRETESLLKEEAAALKEKIAAFEAQPQGEPSLVVLEKMRLEISESKEELERVVKNSRDAILEKDREIEALNSRFRDLSLLYSEARKRIEGFEEEKQDYVSHLEEQKLKERIELENIANALRLSEASDLRNRIKALEVQKDRLEAANKLHSAKDRAAGSSQDQPVATATGLGKRFEELQAKYMAAERVHSEILQQKDCLEEKVLQLSLEGSMQKADAQKENESAIERIESLVLESKQAKRTSETYATELAALNQQLSNIQTENTRLKLEIEDANATVVSSLAAVAMRKKQHEELTKAAQSGETSLIRLILVVVLLRQESRRLSTQIQKLSRENEALLERNYNCLAAFPGGPEDSVSQGKGQGQQQEMSLLPQESNIPLRIANISSETLMGDGDKAPEAGMVSFASIDSARGYESPSFGLQRLVSIPQLAQEFRNMAPGDGDQDAACQDSYVTSSEPNGLETYQNVKEINKGGPAETRKLQWEPLRKGLAERKRVAEEDCSSQDEEADAEMSPSLPRMVLSTPLTAVARGGTEAAKNARVKGGRHGSTPNNMPSSPKMTAQDRGPQTVITPKRTGRHLEALTQAPSRPRTKVPRHRGKKMKEVHESLIDEEKQAKRDGGGQSTPSSNDLRTIPKKKGAKRL